MDPHRFDVLTVIILIESLLHVVLRLGAQAREGECFSLDMAVFRRHCRLYWRDSERMVCLYQSPSGQQGATSRHCRRLMSNRNPLLQSQLHLQGRYHLVARVEQMILHGFYRSRVDIVFPSNIIQCSLNISRIES